MMITMPQKKPTVETLLFVIAFAAAVFIRFIQLGASPLSDSEAQLALQAFNLFHGNTVLLSGQPGYLVWTAVVFTLFGVGNFAARLIPALIGSLFVLTPVLYSKRIGKIPALLLAFAFAIDPGLVAISRHAGGAIFAITFGAAALGFWLNHRRTLAAASLGLALLGGEIVWPILLSLMITWLFGEYLARRKESDQSSLEEPVAHSQENQVRRYDWLRSLAIVIGTVFLAGSIFLVYPKGLSALGESLASYIQGWGNPSGIGSAELFMGLVGYELLAVVWALISLIHGWFINKRLNLLLGIWLVVSILLVMLYPARQVVDLAWVNVILWCLTAIELPGLFHWENHERLPLLGQALQVLIIIVFIWMNLGSVVELSGGLGGNPLSWVAVFGSVIIILLVTLLVGWGWGFNISIKGLGIGSLLALTLYTISGAWGAAGLKPTTSELFYPNTLSSDLDLVTRTVSELSDWKTGDPHTIDGIVAGIDSASLQWQFHTFQGVQFMTQLPLDQLPSIVMTAPDNEVALTATYRGEKYVWRRLPQWEQNGGTAWVHWLLTHEIPTNEDSLILWARADIFPGGSVSSESSTTP